VAPRSLEDRRHGNPAHQWPCDTNGRSPDARHRSVELTENGSSRVTDMGNDVSAARPDNERHDTRNF
jgi:hypothetical protein